MNDDTEIPAEQPDEELDDVYEDAPPVDEYRLSTRPGIVSGGQ